ncbi:hypothetical protein M0812_14129 [Anaeramoeba flamelloides]|uniref:PAS domain-containing protein n=1 Tax=Anaeramoeba flamelloides TaxID=1746091 RepID=A0AAV7ZEK9_9EUKA|nr:hypothetical protein M0812_14129 [Anaeramoeba flamelloides]
MGNSTARHFIKKKHLKKYLKKLEETGLSVCILNKDGKVMKVTPNFIEIVGYVGREKIFRNYKTGSLSAPYQEYFQNNFKESLKIAIREQLNSESGLYTCPWDIIDQYGKLRPLWAYCTPISIGGVIYIQTIWKKRKISGNKKNEKPEEIDTEILKIQINDSKSTASEDNENEDDDENTNASWSWNENENSKSKDDLTQNSSLTNKNVSNSSSSNNPQIKVIREPNKEINIFEDLVQKMKTNSRELKNYKYEYEFINNINTLSSLFEKMYENKNKEIIQYKMKTKTLKNEYIQKINELEKHYSKSISSIDNEKLKLLKNNKTQNEFKKNIKGFYDDFLETYKEQKKIIGGIGDNIINNKDD